MNLAYNAFLKTLPVMGKGMAGIFIVTVVIIAVMLILTSVFKAKK